MATICAKCGASLADGQGFCTSCGTRRSEPAAQIAPRFCTSCGAAVGLGTKFCNACGASLETPPAAHPAPLPQAVSATVSPNAPSPNLAPVAAAPSTATPAAAAPSLPQAPTRKSGLAFKLVMVVVVLFVLGILGMTSGAVYVGYVAKKRVAAVKEALAHDDVGGIVAAAKGDSNSGSQPLPDWKPAPAELLSSPSSKIPIVKTLRVDQAGTDRVLGDYESVFTVDSLDNDAVHVHASEQFPKGKGFEGFFATQNKDTEKLNQIVCARIIYTKDIESSAETDGYFCRQHNEEKHPGTTAMGLSRKTLQELRTTGQAQFKFHQDPLNAVFASFKKALTAADDPASKDKAAYDLMSKMMQFAPVDNGTAMETPAIDCMLRREGSTDLAFPVMVNQQPIQLPVMHVVCKPSGSDHEAHLYVLDDPDNPLFMATATTLGLSGQVIRIAWDTPKHGLEEELEKTGRAKVYDLYFDFRSDVLRPESDKVLKEIAQVMQDHPDWKLSVEGHTDNIGGDAYNLDLSKRRAAAVKIALVKGYGIDATRLLTDGFGRSRPVDTNDTLEGRARNRRVELARQ